MCGESDNDRAIRFPFLPGQRQSGRTHAGGGRPKTMNPHAGHRSPEDERADEE